MIYALFDWLEMNFRFPGAQVFQFLSFRATMAALLSLFIAWLAGKRIIKFLRGKLLGETIRELGPKTHKKKAGTPTMGGLIIIASILIPTLLFADITSGYVWLICLATFWMGIIGFIDDYIKVVKKNKSGLAGKFKVFGQVGLGLIVGLTMVLHPDFTGRNPHVDTLGYVKPNQLLQKKGFMRGDQLVSINGVSLKEARDTWISSDYTTVPQPYADAAPTIRLVSDKTQTPEQKLSHSIGDFEIIRKVSDDGQLKEKQFVLRIDRNVESVLNALFGKPIEGFMYTTNLPFVKTHRINYANLAPQFLGEWGPRLVFIFLAIFIVTAVSNGTNITDGLDGLAGGTAAIVGVAFGLFAYLSGNKIFADYLNIEFIPRSGELLIFSAAFVGACIGFLWYKRLPRHGLHGRYRQPRAGRGGGGAGADGQERTAVADCLWGVFHRIAECDSAGLVFQIHQTPHRRGPTHFQDGPPTPPLRTPGLARGQSRCPFLDHQHPARFVRICHP